jgi:hypothetical protein
MNNIYKINRNLFNIYLLFTREPFSKAYIEELEFFSNGNNSVIGLISFDLIDSDYSAVVLSRDESKQYRAENVKTSLTTSEEAEIWVKKEMNSDKIIIHDNDTVFFDLFNIVAKEKQIHPYFKELNNNEGFSGSKDVIKEISYHYKDIDGNFIEQFQSINGFDARLWELYLFCLCREEGFSFKRNKYAPDFIIEKSNDIIAIEAVTISRDLNKKVDIKNFNPKSREETTKLLENEIPLKFGSALFSKLKKKYWEFEHVKGKPLLIAIADFHDTMSMTWSFPALTSYLYGYKYEAKHDENGKLIITPIKIKGFVKKTGVKIPSGFFNQPDSENISAILFSSTATISKFNRMGKQAGLGSENLSIIRMGAKHNFDENSSESIPFMHQINEECNELWSEGTSIFHNPNALIPLKEELFPAVAHHYFLDEFISSVFPEFFPYFSMNQNIVSIK